MAWVPAATAGISAIGGLLGSGKQAKSQGQASNAAAGLYSAEERAIQQLINQYMQQAPQYFSSAKDLMGRLKSFPDTQQPMIQSLANTMGSANQSLLESLRRQMGGGVANPGALISDMAERNRQSEMQGAQGMQAQLSAEDLQAMGLESGVLGDIGSFITAPLGGALSGLNSMGNTYANAASAGGNPWASGLSGLAAALPSIFPGSSSSPSTYPGLQNTGFNQPGGFTVPLPPMPPLGSFTTPSAAQLGWGQPNPQVTLNPYDTQQQFLGWGNTGR